MKKQLKITTHNNLNAIKFVCAIFVIFHHCYPIAMGKDYVDPVRKITNLQFSFGNFSVLVFLFVAGLLITKSYTKSFFTKTYKETITFTYNSHISNCIYNRTYIYKTFLERIFYKS